VNLVPRLLNAYAGAALPLATEESYWTDLRPGTDHPLFGPTPVDPDMATQ
jgi:hypothetical protein